MIALTNGFATIVCACRPNSSTTVAIRPTMDQGFNALTSLPSASGDRPSSAPRDHARQQGQDHVQHRGEQQRRDRRECNDPDEVVHGHLYERVGRIAAHELAPDEHHGRARRHAEQDHAGDVLPGGRWIDPPGEHVLEEQHAERRHRERLDEPVDDQRQGETAWPAADVADGRPVDLDHHRVDHDPDARRHDEVDEGDLKRCDRRERVRPEQPERDARQNAERHPEGQIALERSKRRGGHRPDLSPPAQAGRGRSPRPRAATAADPARRSAGW